MASFAEPSLFLIDCEVTPLNYAGQVEVESTHLALVKNYANPNDPRLAGESECHLVPTGHLIEERASYLSTRTRVSGPVADHRRKARPGTSRGRCAHGL